MKLSGVTLEGVTATPPRVTVIPATKPYPLTVTVCPPPTGPAAGVSDVTIGGASPCTLCSITVWLPLNELPTAQQLTLPSHATLPRTSALLTSGLAAAVHEVTVSSSISV